MLHMIYGRVWKHIINGFLTILPDYPEIESFFHEESGRPLRFDDARAGGVHRQDNPHSFAGPYTFRTSQSYGTIALLVSSKKRDLLYIWRAARGITLLCVFVQGQKYRSSALAVSSVGSQQVCQRRALQCLRGWKWIATFPFLTVRILNLFLIRSSHTLFDWDRVSIWSKASIYGLIAKRKRDGMDVTTGSKEG